MQAESFCKLFIPSVYKLLTVVMLYTWLKLFHVIAVIVFLGNIFTGLFWMRLAVKTKEVRIINHSINGVILSDRYFTIPGVIFITTAGIFAALVGDIPLIRTGWILWSLILFSISGILFVWKVAPLQKKLSRLTSQNNADSFDWNHFNKTFRDWELWGGIALLTPILALIMMVLKIPK